MIYVVQARDSTGEHIPIISNFRVGVVGWHAHPDHLKLHPSVVVTQLLETELPEPRVALPAVGAQWGHGQWWWW